MGVAIVAQLFTGVVAWLQVLQDEGSQALVSSSAKRPTGRVVGVIRRNWRTRGYAGKQLDCSAAHASMHHFMPTDMSCVIHLPQSVASDHCTSASGLPWSSCSGCCCCLQAACNPASGGRLPTAPPMFCLSLWSASSQ